MKSKKLLLGSCVGVASLMLAVAVAANSNGGNLFKTTATDSWRHYSAVASSSSNNGLREYWTNCNGTTTLANPGVEAIDYAGDAALVSSIVSEYGAQDARITPRSEQFISASSSINLINALCISGTEDSISYSVTDKNGEAVSVSSNSFTSGVVGNYYKASVSFTVDGVACINKSTLVVEGTYYDSLESTAISTWVSNDAVSRREVVEEDRNRCFGFTINNSKAIVYNIPLATRNGVSLSANKIYHISFRVWSNDLQGSDIINISQTYDPIAGSQGEISASTPSAYFSFTYKMPDNLRFSTFKFGTNATNVEFFVDDILVVEDAAFNYSACTIKYQTDGSKVLATKGVGKFNLFSTALLGLSAGDNVRITINYKTEIHANSNQRVLRCVGWDGSATTLTHNAALALNTSGSVTIDTQVFTSSGFDTETITAVSGALIPHLKFSFIAGGSVDSYLTITSITIQAL